MIPYGRQQLDNADIQAVLEVLKGDWLTCGPCVSEFEEKLADYCGAKHVIAVSNGTAALHVAMLAANIGTGDRVLTSPNTFLASANCSEYVGATADFVDISPETLNLSPELLEKNWKADTKAVVAVDFAGRPCNMPAIYKHANGHGAIVIEDAAHAIGSRFMYEGEEFNVGGHPWADMTTFSFHPVKTMTSGEGGAIATDDNDLAARCRSFRNHGMMKTRPAEPWHYEMLEPGYNYRITDLQCALGISQLSKLDDFSERRQDITDSYNKALSELDWLICPVSDFAQNGFTPSRVAWHLYVVQINFSRIGKSRAQVMDELRKLGVGTQVHYIPVHTQPYYQNKYGYGWGDCPVTESYYERCLSLPLYPSMNDEDVGRVISAVRGLR